MSLRPIQVSPTELSQLIALVYPGAEDARRWEDCLERLRRLVHAHTANFLFAAWEDHATHVALSVGQASEGVHAYNEHWQRHDVWLRSGAPELEQSGRVYGSQALASDETVKASAIYNELYRGLGIFHGLLSTIVAEPRRTAVLSVNYTYAEGPTDAGRHELFELLTPHFQRAIALYERLHQRDAQTAGFQEYLNRSPVGFALLRGDGRLLFANHAFEAVTTARDGLRRKQDRLVAGDSDADSALARAIREAAATSERRGTLAGGALRVPRLPAVAPMSSRSVRSATRARCSISTAPASRCWSPIRTPSRRDCRRRCGPSGE